MDDMSISSRCGSAGVAAAMPSSPKTARSTTAAELRLVMTKSLAAAASRAVAAAAAPCSASAATLAASRSNTLTRWPHSRSRREMAEPMMPTPITATRVAGAEVFVMRRLSWVAGAGARHGAKGSR